MSDDKIKQLVWKLTLHNAVQYGGHAKTESIIGRILAERPDLKFKIKEEVIPVLNLTIRKVNSLSLDEQKKLIEEKWPELLAESRVKSEIKQLPPLLNVQNYPFVHVRFCPNPDGALHLGGSRAAVLCDEYAKLYKGRFTLRFDDTDPRTKSPILEAYDWIRNDLQWLGISWQSEVYQSDRLEIYYEYAKQLIKMGKAYICLCKIEEFRQLLLAKQECPCRSLPPEEHLERWNRMLNGFYKEGVAVVRIKTKLNHPNPAVRDWPALRIIDVKRFPHPRTRDKYWVWPLFAFCCGIDDHDLAISHILRGKEHLTNSTRQIFLYDYFGWKYPEAIHYGRLKMVGTVLSKSKIRDGIIKKIYSGWDDPRLGTLKALRKRGFLPETIRQLILDVGPKAVDVTISWENLQAYNRKLLDPIANRYFFVSSPIILSIRKIDKPYICKQFLHPNYHERGYRTLNISPEDDNTRLFISKNDLKFFKLDKIVRLMGLFNVKVKSVNGELITDFHSEPYLFAKKAKAPLIHWIPNNSGISTNIIMPDASIVEGLAEEECKKLHHDDIIQFERFGFVRIENNDEKLIAYYTHK